MKDSFIVRYATHLLLLQLGVPGGLLGAFAGFIVANILGAFVDRGIIEIDITLDSLKQAMKDSAWRADAERVYATASARVYTEEEKNEIRQQYQKVLSDYATLGSGAVVPGVPINEEDPKS